MEKLSYTVIYYILADTIPTMILLYIYGSHSFFKHQISGLFKDFPFQAKFLQNSRTWRGKASEVNYFYKTENFYNEN